LGTVDLQSFIQQLQTEIAEKCIQSGGGKK